MKTSRQELIDPTRYQIIDLTTKSSSLVQLLACDLNENIAFTLYSSDLKKAGMGVGLDVADIGCMLDAFTNRQDNLKIGSIEVKLAGGNVGGKTRTKAEDNVETLINALQQWDGERNVINITHQNILNEKGHNAFVFSPTNNTVQPYNVVQSTINRGCCTLS